MTQEELALHAFLRTLGAVYVTFGVIGIATSVVAAVCVAIAILRSSPPILTVGIALWVTASILDLAWWAQGVWPLAAAATAVVPLIMVLGGVDRLRQTPDPRTVTASVSGSDSGAGPDDVGRLEMLFA